MFFILEIGKFKLDFYWRVCGKEFLRGKSIFGYRDYLGVGFFIFIELGVGGGSLNF